MQTQETEAVLAEIDDSEEAEKLRTRSEYPWDTAGGIDADIVRFFFRKSHDW